MRIVDHEITLERMSDRVELFPIGDCHIGKRNCAEDALKKQVREIMSHSRRADRQVRVLLGGDICDYVRPGDTKRYNVSALADWLVSGGAEAVRANLNDIAKQQTKRAFSIFSPIQHLIIGAIEGNHEYSIMHYNNFNVHEELCEQLGVPDLSDEALIRFHFHFRSKTQTIFVYSQHGHGGGRSPGSEPTHLTRIRDEWEAADVVLRGHSHTFHVLPPKPILFIPSRGQVPRSPLTRMRYAANWGCWLDSHSTGPSTYESRASYPARPMMTVKVVLWPFHQVKTHGQQFVVPKIEMRHYDIM